MPSGWYQISWSEEVHPGQVLPVQAFDEELILCREVDGSLFLMDAYCRHMGAHLGYGGEVRDDCVVCPFHGWAWNANGSVADIPYTSKPNRSRRMETRPVREVSGLVFAWYAADRSEPLWESPIPEISEHYSPHHYPIWPEAVRMQEFSGHPQFVVENTVDFAHFVHVHRWALYPTVEILGADGYSYATRTCAKLETRRGLVDQVVDVRAWGLGIVISRHEFEFDDPDASVASEVTIICTTPTSGGKSTMRMTAWLPRGAGEEGDIPMGRAAVLLHAAHREVFEHDWRIWQHLRYDPQPGYTIEEARGFKDIRRWADQFYPDSGSGA